MFMHTMGDRKIMTYVDDMRAPFGRLIMCHMIADTDAELRVMADKIGVSQRWHQGDHFDICLSKRALAVKHGAQEITRQELGRIVIARRRSTAL
jgi:hypothetical protein